MLTGERTARHQPKSTLATAQLVDDTETSATASKAARSRCGISPPDYARKHAKWQDARAEYAKRTGVELPKSEDVRPLDHFAWQKPTPSVYYHVQKNKPGIDRESIVRAGGILGRWPVRVQQEHRQHLLSFRCWGPDLFNADAVGVHCMRYDGRRVEIRSGKDVKYSKTMQKGPPGIISNWAVANWKTAKIVWVVEGLSDMLAVQKLLGDRTDEVVITMGGVSYVPDGQLLELFTGKRVWICFDVDPPSEKSHSGAGQAGAARWSAAMAGVAESVRNVRLPYEGLSVKRDVRDWILEGNGYDELRALADKYADMRGSEAKAQVAGLAKRGVITNIVSVDNGEGGTASHPIAMRDIVERTRAITDNWPRRVGNQLFYHSPGEEPWYLRSSSDLFAFYHRFGVSWNDRHNECVRRAELLSELKHSATDYDAIESYPHFPEPIERCYYTCENDVEPGDGKAMLGFMDFFRPSTPIDYFLMQSAMMTLFWNGPAGARPCFLFTTSDDAGKRWTWLRKVGYSHEVG